MLFAVYIMVDIQSANPVWLNEQLHDLVMPTVEAGLYEHKLSLETHMENVKDVLERTGSTEQLNDSVDMMAMWLLLGFMLAMATIICAVEMMVGFFNA